MPTFTLQAFRINKTRALHNDTVFVSCSSSDGQTVKKSMGNLNDGNYPVDLRISQQAGGHEISFSFVIGNYGHENRSTVEQAFSAASTAAAKYAGSYGMLVAAVAGLLQYLIFLDCDGMVATDVITMKPDAGAKPQTFTQKYSYPSQVGCGDSPDYDVTFTISGGTVTSIKSRAGNKPHKGRKREPKRHDK